MSEEELGDVEEATPKAKKKKKDVGVGVCHQELDEAAAQAAAEEATPKVQQRDVGVGASVGDDEELAGAPEVGADDADVSSKTRPGHKDEEDEASTGENEDLAEAPGMGSAADVADVSTKRKRPRPTDGYGKGALYFINH